MKNVIFLSAGNKSRQIGLQEGLGLALNILAECIVFDFLARS